MLAICTSQGLITTQPSPSLSFCWVGLEGTCSTGFCFGQVMLGLVCVTMFEFLLVHTIIVSWYWQFYWVDIN